MFVAVPVSGSLPGIVKTVIIADGMLSVINYKHAKGIIVEAEKTSITKHSKVIMMLRYNFYRWNDFVIHFRKRSGQIIEDYTIQSWTMDKDRLIKGHMFIFKYFECLL